MLLSSHSEPCLFGGLLDSVEMSISLPSEKLDAIIKTAREILKDRAVTYKVLSSFLGRLSHAAQTGVLTAPLHYRSIQQQHVRMTCQPSGWPTTAQVFLSQKSIEESFFRTYTPTPRHILLQMDNSTAVAYVNKRGGTRSYGLSTEALKLWALVLHAGCWITAKHVPGTSNTIADLASRQFTSYSEWTLDRDVFHQIAQRIYRPDVDLFATRANHRLPRYVSRYPDPGAMATDAFLCDWSQWRSWIYAPLVLLPRIIQKIKRDKATALILAPVWKGQPWFPSLLELLMDYPRQLPQIPNLITLPSQPEKEHPLQHSLRLTVWPVSGSVTAQTDFRRRLRRFCCHPGADLWAMERLVKLVSCTVSLSLYSPCEQRADLLSRDSREGQFGLQNDRCV